MRITIVIAGLGGGGAERVCINLANAWATRGKHATLLTISQKSQPPAYAIDPHVEVRDVGCPRSARSYELNAAAVAPVMRGINNEACANLSPDIEILAMLRYAILETSPDVVVSFIDGTNVRVLAAMLETGVPVVACEVTDSRRVSLGRLQRARETLYRGAAAVVAPDPSITQWLASRHAPATTIAHPLVAPPKVVSSKSRSRRRVVTLSRLSAEKRPEFLLRSFASIAVNHPDWDLEFYGVGPQQNTLEHLAEALAPGRIRFCGFSNDPYAILADVDLFVSASRLEGFGNAIWEALACGVPVVAMDAGPPVRSLVRDGVDGVIVRPDTMAALASAMSQLMSNEAKRKAFALRAPEVVQRFSMESALEKWDELLKKVTQM